MFTTVVGVDSKHLRQLDLVWPTWKRHKPSLLDSPMVIFYDRWQVLPDVVHDVCDHPNLTLYPWPPAGVSAADYQGDGSGKWGDPQRAMMLSGFVHVPPAVIETPYWLKIDTDTIATGCDDWINMDWFYDRPAIVAQKWTFTKPPDQMQRLDEWAGQGNDTRFEEPPLGLIPEPGKPRLGHKRIISWCGFFSRQLSTLAATLARTSCGIGMLPVPSQDGYMWYCARRMGWPIRRVNVKSLGWLHRSTMVNIKAEANKAME